MQSQTEHRQALHGPHRAAKACAAPPDPIPGTPATSLCPSSPPGVAQPSAKLLLPSLSAQEKPPTPQSRGLERGGRACSGSQPLLDIPQPAESGFQARQVCSELKKCKHSWVWPAPCPQGTWSSWQDTHTLLVPVSSLVKSPKFFLETRDK